MKRVINIVKIEGLMIQFIKSFIIEDEDKHLDVVKSAEKFFISECLEHSKYNRHFIISKIEEGYIKLPKGIEYLIIWSE